MEKRHLYTISGSTMLIDEFGHSRIFHKDGTLLDMSLSDNRYLVVTGIIMPRAKAEEVKASLARLKTRHGINPGVYLHRSGLELPSEQGVYASLYPYEARQAFYKDFLGLLLAWDYKIVSVLIDKPYYLTMHTEDAYCYCLRILLDRFVLFLQETGGKGNLVYESRGRDSDAELEAAFAELRQKGTKYTYGLETEPGKRGRRGSLEEFLRSKDTIVSRLKDNNIPGLQVADFIAYASFFDMLGKDADGTYPYLVYNKSAGGVVKAQPKNLSKRIIDTVLAQTYYWRISSTGRGYQAGRVVVRARK